MTPTGIALQKLREEIEAPLHAEIARLRAEKAELIKARNAEEMQQRIDYWGRRAEKAEDEVVRLRDELKNMQIAGSETVARLRAELAETVPNIAREDELDRLRADNDMLMKSLQECQVQAMESRAEVDRLRERKTPATRQLLNLTKALLDDANADNERVLAILKECADSLEEELRGRYKDTLDYPSEKRRFDRDMGPVDKARAALAADGKA